MLIKFNYEKIDIEKRLKTDSKIINDFQQKFGSILNAATHTRRDLTYSITQLAKVCSNQQMNYVNI